MFLHNFRQFSENWSFEGISTGADLTKMVNIWTILNCAKKIFFGKIIYSTHQKKCFSTILGNFWKIDFWRNINRCGGPYKNGEYLYYLKLCKEIIFWQNYLFHSSKEEFLHNVTQFWKIEFLKEYRQARTLQKWWKFVLSQFVLRKYFLAKLFVPLIKESVSPQCYAILENWIFEGISTGADLTKMVNICTILNCAKKLFFGKIICSTHQRKSFSTILGNFWKIEFLKEYQQARGPYKNGEYLYYLKLCKEINFWQNYLFHSSKDEFFHNFRQFLENWSLKEYQQARTLQKWWNLYNLNLC